MISLSFIPYQVIVFDNGGIVDSVFWNKRTLTIGGQKMMCQIDSQCGKN